MDKGFYQYKEELGQVRMTQESKKALAEALAAYQPERTAKRPPRRGRMILVTAVLLLGALTLLAAARPGFWSMLGVHFSTDDSEDGRTRLYSYIDGGTECPIEVAEGRVWFVLDGQHTDITGKFDDQNAYVYEMTNPETGLPNYILVGWSAGGIEYGEIVFLPEDEGDGVHPFAAHTLGVVRMDPDYPIFDHTYPVEDLTSDSGNWFSNAVEELCAPYLEKIRPPEGTCEAQPPMTDTAAPELPPFPDFPGVGED